MTTPPPVRWLPDVLAARAGTLPHRIAHDDTSTALTFAGWHHRVCEVAGGLVTAGVTTGDRVLLPVTNQHAVGFAVAYLAVQRARAIAVPLSTRLTADEIRYFAGLVAARWAVTDVPDRLAGLDLTEVWDVMDMPCDDVALPAPPEPDADTDADVDVDADADADIMSTSGTTGRPKGVVFGHAELVERMGDLTAPLRPQTLLHALPFTGFGGCHGLMLSALQYGNTVITQPSFDPAKFLDLIESRRPDTLHLVPAMLRLILDQPDAAHRDLSSVRWLITGTAPVPSDSVARVATLWPHVKVINVYGMTEGSTAISTRSRASVRKPGSVGRPDDADALQIRGADGQRLPDGTTGEVWTRSGRPRRYWNDPQATRATWHDGWLRTGDLGYIDTDGDLILTGRSKDLIIRGGYNISPAEVEDALHAHPAVAEAAVVGVPHEVLGEDVAAAVVLRGGATATVDELADWCRSRLARMKVPRVVVLVDHLPRNQNTKVVKRDLLPLLEQAAREMRSAAPGSRRSG